MIFIHAIVNHEKQEEVKVATTVIQLINFSYSTIHEKGMHASYWLVRLYNSTWKEQQSTNFFTNTTRSLLCNWSTPISPQNLQYCLITVGPHLWFHYVILVADSWNPRWDDGYFQSVTVMTVRVTRGAFWLTKSPGLPSPHNDRHWS